MPKKFFAWLLLFLCLTASALADTFVTPLRHTNQDIRDEIWTLIAERIAPQVGKDPQEKWSASYCREVVDLFEHAGFIISDEVKDELYRTPRTHRWYASEAWMKILESQFDRQWFWSLTDIVLYEQTMCSAGIIVDRYMLPDDTTPPLSDMVELFRQQIAQMPAMPGDPAQGYHIVARLMNWGGFVRWELQAFATLEDKFPRDAFSMSYSIKDRTFEMHDWREDNAGSSK